MLGCLVAAANESAGLTGYRLSDRGLAANWSHFHRANAVLELLTPEQNISIGSGGYKMRFVDGG